MRKGFLLLVLTSVLAACGTAESTPTTVPTATIAATPTTDSAAYPTPDLAQSEINPMLIESVAVSVKESMPPQVSVEINGMLNDGCTSFHEAKQSIDGNTIKIEVTTIRPKDAMCNQQISPFSTIIQIEGELKPGEYTILVNDVAEALKL
ncbi:hypothetical protein [Herpetosiphon gulosus]|uniref:Lipoprotein n=1 Tax=Herpetosiphon gulosus TaxID=1973496 RepID=A0ABP9X3G5_9CHLR